MGLISLFFQYFNCYLSRRLSLSSNLANTASAFISGISFYLYPSHQLLAHAMAITVNMGWSLYLNQTKDTVDRPVVVKWLSQVPIARLFYPLAFAYLLQMRVFYPWLAPPVLKHLMNLTTNFKYVFQDVLFLFFNRFLYFFLETTK